MQITRYVLVDANDREDDNEFDTLAAAQREARAWDCPVAIIERTYEYDDSSLVWTHDGSTSWPPNSPRRRTAEDCNPEYLLSNLPDGLAVTIHLPDGPVDAMWAGCNRNEVTYKAWPGHEPAAWTLDAIPGELLAAAWTDINRIEIH